MDYAAWVQQLLAFATGSGCGGLRISVTPPLAEGDLTELEEALDCGLPPPLRRFLATGASALTLTRGEEEEETFAPADHLANWREQAQDYAAKSWVTEPDWPLDRAFWRHALPLVQYPDGDGLALWVHDPQFPEPAVVYLRHDAESVLLCRTFDEFLTTWADLGYTSVAEMAECRNPATGFLDLRSPRAAALRASWLQAAPGTLGDPK